MIVSFAAAALAVQLSMTPGSAVAPDDCTCVAPSRAIPCPRPPTAMRRWLGSERARRPLLSERLSAAAGPGRKAISASYYGGGRYPVPCGHGADLDVRDGQCYPNGTVPPQYQQGRQRYYGDRVPTPAAGPVLLSGLSLRVDRSGSGTGNGSTCKGMSEPCVRSPCPNWCEANARLPERYGRRSSATASATTAMSEAMV